MSATKPLAIAATLATLTVSAWAGISHVTGGRVEAALQRQYADLSELPFVAVKERRYERTLTGATEDVTLALGCPAVDLPNGAGKAGITVQVRNRIAHGPFAGGAFGAARIETDVVLPAEVQSKLAALFGDRKPFSAVTRVGFDGALQSTLEVAPLTFDRAALAALAGQAVADRQPIGTLRWDGMVVTSRLSGDRARTDYRGEVRPLRLAEPDGGTFTTSAATFEGRGKRIDGWLYDDDGRFAMASLDIDLPGHDGSDGRRARPAMALSLKNLGGSSVLAFADGYLSQVQRLEIGALEVDRKAYGKVNYDTSVERIHLATLADALRSIAGSGRFDCASVGDGSLEKRLGPVLETLKRTAFELLRHEPRFGVDRVSLTTPEGVARIGYRVSLGQITEADLADPQRLLTKVGLKADASISEAMIARFVRQAFEDRRGGVGGPSAEQLDQMIGEGTRPMVEQGYLQRADGTLSSSLELKAGRVSVNGKPLDDQVAGMAIGAMAQAAGRLGAAQATTDDEDDEGDDAAPDADDTPARTSQAAPAPVAPVAAAPRAPHALR